MIKVQNEAVKFCRCGSNDKEEKIIALRLLTGMEVNRYVLHALNMAKVARLCKCKNCKNPSGQKTKTRKHQSHMWSRKIESSVKALDKMGESIHIGSRTPLEYLLISSIIQYYFDNNIIPAPDFMAKILSTICNKSTSLGFTLPFTALTADKVKMNMNESCKNLKPYM